MIDGPLHDHLKAARRANVNWTPAREQQVSWATIARFEHRRRGTERALLVGGTIAMAALGALIAFIARPLLGTSRPTTIGAPLASTLDDGSRIVLDDPSTVLRRAVDRPRETVFALDAGGATFDVAHRASRAFRVKTDNVSIDVINTRFHVQRFGPRSRISVDRGRVRVSWTGGAAELVAGQSGFFPPDDRASAIVPDDEALPGAINSTVAVPSAASPIAAARRRRSTAVNASTAAPTNAAPGDAATLFAQADDLRRAGRSAAAVASLGELVRRFPNDPRAAAAAFTMGRLFLERLGDSRKAAAAFADARRLSTTSAMTEDALAREVEALAKSGDGAAAQRRAELYRDLYPTSARLPAVMRFAGLRL